MLLKNYHNQHFPVSMNCMHLSESPCTHGKNPTYLFTRAVDSIKERSYENLE
jgi:hypothetical protein